MIGIDKTEIDKAELETVPIACPPLQEQKKIAEILSACSKQLGFVESSEYFGKRVFCADTSNYKAIHRGYFGYPSNHIEEGSIGLLIDLYRIAVLLTEYFI